MQQDFLQENNVGRDKLEVAQILKEHHALVRGGPEQGTKLVEALLVSHLSLAGKCLQRPCDWPQQFCCRHRMLMPAAALA